MAKRAPKTEPPPAGPLGEFGGKPVTKMAMAMRNAGDGFTDAIDLGMSPHETGTEVYCVMKCIVGPIDHDPLLDTGKKAKKDELAEFTSYRRVEDWIAQQGIEVDAERVSEWLEESAAAATKRREEKAKAEQRAEEEAAGIMRLVPDADDEPDDGSDEEGY